LSKNLKKNKNSPENVSESDLNQKIQQVERLEAIGQLAGGIVHDFNNVLAGIIGIGEIGLRSIPENDHAYGVIKKIINKADEAASLVRQLMVFSRSKQFKPRKTYLNPIIKNNYRLLERYLGENIILETNLAEELLPIKTDMTAIDQIIINLSINARDAMPDGGVLTIGTKNVLLDKSSSFSGETVNPGQYVELSITDNGVGMSSEILERIFEPFYTTKGIGYGTGLGLSIVQSLVKQHHAYISCKSSIGEGTGFRVLFPAYVGEETSKKDSQEESSTNGSETILIAEDNPDLLDSYQQVLREYGYHVITASDGLAALTLFENRKDDIDLILTDVVMPGFGGMEFKLVAEQIKPEIKFILMSSHGNRVEPDIPFLQKPFQAVRLVAKVRSVIDSNDEN